MAKSKTPHMVMGNNSFRCLNCGRDYDLDGAMSSPQGLSINMAAAMAKQFSKDHAKCKPSPAGKARFEYKTPDEWRHSWDTGISSMAIWNVMMQAGRGKDRSPPQDPDDFGRCHRLLEAFPNWRPRMPEVAKMYPTWNGLVEHWDELTKLYVEELPTGSAPKLYTRMRELLGTE